MSSERFGEMFKRLRIAKGESLRSFCLSNGYDPGNISKTERGKLAPPESEALLAGYAESLGLKKGSDDWIAFFDRAAAERGRLPADLLLNDEELVNKLPVLFRSMREADPLSEDALRQFAEEIRRL